MRTPRLASVAAVLALATALAACGDDGSDSSEEVTETVTASPSETTEATTSAPTETTPSAPMDPSEGDITQEQVEAALLTAAEVGPEFVDSSWTDESTPPLCDPEGTPVDEQVPAQVKGGTQIDHTEGIASMVEEIAIYATEAEATEAFTLASAGLGCTEGTTDDGQSVTIGPPQDVTAQVNSSGIGTSTAWEVSSDSFDGVVVATLAGRIVMACSFASAPDADVSALPDPVSVAADAFAKALAN